MILTFITPTPQKGSNNLTIPVINSLHGSHDETAHELVHHVRLQDDVGVVEMLPTFSQQNIYIDVCRNSNQIERFLMQFNSLLNLKLKEISSKNKKQQIKRY